jgi:hypothetical protein
MPTPTPCSAPAAPGGRGRVPGVAGGAGSGTVDDRHRERRAVGDDAVGPTGPPVGRHGDVDGRGVPGEQSEVHQCRGVAEGTAGPQRGSAGADVPFPHPVGEGQDARVGEDEVTVGQPAVDAAGTGGERDLVAAGGTVREQGRERVHARTLADQAAPALAACGQRERRTPAAQNSAHRPPRRRARTRSTPSARAPRRRAPTSSTGGDGPVQWTSVAQNRGDSRPPVSIASPAPAGAGGTGATPWGPARRRRAAGPGWARRSAW